MRRVRTLLAATLVMACGSSDHRQIRIDLQVRGSCGASTLAYDTSCIQAVQVSMFGLDGTAYRSQCSFIGGRYGNLQELVASEEVVSVLSGVRTRKDIYLEFRAYHSFDKTPCTDQTEDDLMLWGTSPVIDLTKSATEAVAVSVECRPECHCGALQPGAGSCPYALERGVCAPRQDSLCRKPCSSAASCYDATLACVAGSCSDTKFVDCCSPTARGSCFECSSDADCDSGICVHNVETDEWFCAEACPPAGGVEPCHTGMSCRRLSNETFARAP